MPDAGTDALKLPALLCSLEWCGVGSVDPPECNDAVNDAESGLLIDVEKDEPAVAMGVGIVGRGGREMGEEGEEPEGEARC